MRSPDFQRRTFLKTLGLAGASLALPSMPRTSRASSDGGPPLRMVFVFHEHGVFYDTWKMRRAGLPTGEDQGWEFDLTALGESEFSESLRPLWQFRDQMMVLDGLSYLPAMNDPFGDAHAKGWVSSLTGNWARETYDGVKSHAASASLDQIIKQSSRDADPTLTDLASLELGVRPWNGGFHHLNYATDEQGNAYKVPFEADPHAAFAMLFPDPNADSPAQPDPIALARPDVMATARAEYDRLMPHLSNDDRAKLTLHRDMIADLQARLEAQAALDCSAPIIDYAGPQEWEGNGGEFFAWKTQAFTDMLAVALSCGLTRVATLQLAVAPNDLLGAAGDDFHHDYAHQSGPGASPEKVAVVTANVNEHARQVAALAERLAQIPEAEGTVLDNTVIVWMSELATGGHTHDQVPIVLLGGSKGLFRMGRYLRFPRDTPMPVRTSADPGGLVGRPHNRLLVSLAQAMGVQTDVIGSSQLDAKGPEGSSTVDLRGPLDELY